MATASAEINIVNRALTLLGVNTITALTDPDKAASTASVLWDDTRAAVFRSHPWNCLTKRVALSKDSVAPAYGYSAKFQLPADFLRLIRLENPKENYQIENDFILYDGTALNIQYLALITDVTKYDTLLVDALAARLAADLAQPLLQSTAAMEKMYAMFELKLKEARYVDAQENCQDVLDADYWLDSRSGLTRANIETPPRN
jgi:hypothetical protein|tara:strand:- start:11387 stop:11992 length:606 start_codon:yes stop_codon:yes gene_type:complete